MLSEEFSETCFYTATHTLGLPLKPLWRYYVENLPLLDYYSDGLGGLSEINGRFINLTFPMAFDISTWGTGRLQFPHVTIYIGGKLYPMTHEQEFRLRALLNTLELDFRNFIEYAAFIKEILLSDQCVEFAKQNILGIV